MKEYPWLDEDPEYHAFKATLKRYKATLRQAVRRAIKTGRLVRPYTCEGCGRSGVRLLAHHPVSLKSFSLRVEWLCFSCHGRIHSKRYQMLRMMLQTEWEHDHPWKRGDSAPFPLVPPGLVLAWGRAQKPYGAHRKEATHAGG